MNWKLFHIYEDEVLTTGDELVKRRLCLCVCTGDVTSSVGANVNFH